MADFNIDEVRGVFATDDIIPIGEDSNFGRFLKATAERLANTKFFRRVYWASAPGGTGLEFPYAAVLPTDLPETERMNVSNWKTYTVVVMLCLLDDNVYRGTLRAMAMREKCEHVCRSKARIQLEDGDIHENTLLETTPWIVPEAEGGNFVFSTGFRIKYECTEPRKEE